MLLNFIFFTSTKKDPKVFKYDPHFHFPCMHFSIVFIDVFTIHFFLDIRKTCPCNVYPLEPHFYCKTGVCRGISFLAHLSR